MPAAQAIKTAMQHVRGKGVAFNNAGSQRIFLNAIFQTYGGLKYSDVKLTVTSDAQIVQLAAGGQIQFATPDGAAQNVQLLHQGWKPLVSVSDLEKVPASKDIVAASLSHEGPAGLLSYYQQNKETVLRFMSVMFRTIDELVKTPEQFSLLSPYITARAGVPVPTSSLITIFKDINPFVPFDQQSIYWDGGTGNSQSYDTVYGQQIKAAQQGGLLPKSENLTPGDAIIGKEIWQTLLDLKHRYDTIVSNPAKNTTLAKQAAAQYAQRNYLDAYRFLKAAQG
jgi:hypothetical protein